MYKQLGHSAYWISVRSAWAIIYLSIANVFVWFYNSRRTILIEFSMSGIHEEFYEGKKLLSWSSHKNYEERIAFLLAVSMPAVCIFAIFRNLWWPGGCFSLIKSHARTKRVLRARHWKRNGEKEEYREEAMASLQLYKRFHEFWKRSGSMKNP